MAVPIPRSNLPNRVTREALREEQEDTAVPLDEPLAQEQEDTVVLLDEPLAQEQEDTTVPLDEPIAQEQEDAAVPLDETPTKQEDKTLPEAVDSKTKCIHLGTASQAAPTGMITCEVQPHDNNTKVVQLRDENICSSTLRNLAKFKKGALKEMCISRNIDIGDASKKKQFIQLLQGSDTSTHEVL